MKNYSSTLERLRQELSELHPYGKDAIKETMKALGIVKKALAAVEKDINLHGFPSNKEEIYYFKEVKPVLCSLQIAYGIILKIEQMRPLSTNREIDKAIRRNIKFLKIHFNDFSEFVAYYNSELDHQDEKYFLRVNKCFVSYNTLLSAQALTTGYDLVAAYVLACKFVMDHYKIPTTTNEKIPTIQPVKWSMDKVAFVELISGLYSMNAVQGRNKDLRTLAEDLGTIFGIEIKDIYGKRKEIKLRKGDRFRFLREMISTLEKEFDESLEA